MIFGLVEQGIEYFFSIFLIGVWFAYSIKFIAKVKSYREFRSPHNTPFFVLSTLIIGHLLLYAGYYTPILGANLIEDNSLIIFENTWILIFAFPYLVYGLYSIYSSFRKYEIVYIYQSKSINASKFGFIICFFIFVFNTIFLGLVLENTPFFDISPLYNKLDIIFIIFNISAFLILLAFGVIYRRKSISHLTPDRLARRRNRLERVTAATTEAIRRPTRRITSQRSAPQARTQSQPARRRPAPKPKPQNIQQPKKNVDKKKLIKLFHKIKPKGQVLSTEDFKCIFCFSLPKLPNDKGRGIIVCPHCKRPAHADEFNDWHRSSSLCSRCDTAISSSYLRKPPIYSVKLYLSAYRYFKKKGFIKD